MYSITGITGQVGGAVARKLLAEGHKVRAVIRDASKAAALEKMGCEVAIADMADSKALIQAFEGSEAVFTLCPPNFDPSPGYVESKAYISALAVALRAVSTARVVVISTVGAQAKQDNLLSQLQLLEVAFRDLPNPVTFLRLGWFMENTFWDIEPAMKLGVVSSFLQPLDRAIPMVATEDVGTVAAELLVAPWTGHRVVELEGPDLVSPHDIAACLAKILGRDVQAVAVPRNTWEALFKSHGMKNPTPRARMLDGFNEGWICFEGTPRKGTTSLETVLRSLVARAS